MDNLVSIVIPVYNMEKYLTKCLESAVNQTYGNIEILCIDDGSTDNSAAIIRSFSEKDSRIKYFYQENRGLSAVRNVGMEKSLGDYILFLDSDDYLHTRAVERMLKAAVSTEADIVCSEIERVCDSNADIYCKINNNEITNISYEDMYVKYKCGFIVNGNMYKRELLNGKYFLEEMLNGEDSVFMLQVLLVAKKIVFVDDVCYFYCLARTDSLSRNVNYRFSMSYLVEAAAYCYEIANKADNDVLKTVYIKGLYSTLFEHRIRCKNTDCEKETKRKINKFGRKYLKALKSDGGVPFAEKAAIVISFRVPAMYKVFRVIKDPTMLKVYLQRG